jgi:hypothetical protein
MSTDIPKNKWAVIIDTNKYAGNFERELCAYCTGIIGECEVGDDLVPSFQEYIKTIGWKENKFEEVVAQVADDHGCERPVSIYPNPRWFNNGVGGEYRKAEKNVEEKALCGYINEVIRDNKESLNRIKHMIGKSNAELEASRAGWTKAEIDKEMTRYNKEIERAKNTKKVSHYPSYCSVAIFFEEKPSEEMIDIIKQRASEYCKSPEVRGKRGIFTKEIIKIEGYRLIYSKATDIETEI